MQVPLDIVFHNMDRSEAMEAQVRDRVARLERHTDNIIACRVVLEAPQKQVHHSLIQIVLKVCLPNKEIVVKRERRRQGSKGDRQQVIGAAFDVAERQLEEHLKILRHDVKTHDGPSYARIVKLYPDQDYGFIETPLHLNVYFRGEVVDGESFDTLAIGDEVLYTMASDEGPMGPQASRVRLVRGEHPVR
jgi:ribosome-associated translation inhibitor RaiA